MSPMPGTEHGPPAGSAVEVADNVLADSGLPDAALPSGFAVPDVSAIPAVTATRTKPISTTSMASAIAALRGARRMVNISGAPGDFGDRMSAQWAGAWTGLGGRPAAVCCPPCPACGQTGFAEPDGLPTSGCASRPDSGASADRALVGFVSSQRRT